MKEHTNISYENLLCLILLTTNKQLKTRLLKYKNGNMFTLFIIKISSLII